MTSFRLPSTALVSLLAALTTWLTISTWAGFSEEPGAYLRPIAFGCLLVAVSGMLLRAARLHPLLVVLAQLILVAVWLNHEFAADASLFGLVPTPTSIGDCFSAIGTSADAAQSYAAPVPRSVPGFPPVLILTGTLAALLVDFLACGLRKVPVAGLPLLAMYTAPVSLLDGNVSWWRFALIALCFLGMLAGEEASRLAHWGRDLGVTASSTWTRAATSTVWPSARRIGATATGLAVLLPIFIPTFAGGILTGSGEGAGSGNGDGVRIINPMVNMKRDLERGNDVDMLRVTTSDPEPDYLRIAVLDGFDGSAWKPTKRDIPIDHRVDGELPAPEGLDGDIAAPAHDWEIQASSAFKSQWLPAPYPSVRIDVPGDWRYDESTMDFISAAQNKTTARLRYDLTGLDVDPTPDELRASGAIPSNIFRRYTTVPRAVDEWVEVLAQEVTKTGRNRAERAALLQNWFSKPHQNEAADPSFTYDIAQADAGSSAEDLQDFLQGARTGYCEQFAAAMALMARTLQIPARVAVGFLKPERDGADSWMFSSHDLHAWPELYFEGIGWTRFEPTPATRQGATAPAYTAGLQPSANPTQSPSASATTGNPSPTDQPSRRPDLPAEPVDTDPLDRSGPNWAVVLLVVLVVLALLSTVPRIVRTVVRRRRWAAASSPLDLGEAAWAELRDSMIDLRLPWDDRVTVRQRAREIGPLFCRRPGRGEEDLARVIRNNPDAQAALDRIVLFIERARYARSAPDVADLKADVDLCVEALRIGLEPGVRRRADWLPVSLLPSRSRRTPVRTSEVATLEEPSLNR